MPVSLAVERLDEQVGRRQPQRFARLAGQAASDDQGNAATGAHFIGQRDRLKPESGNHFAGGVMNLALERVNGDHVAHFQCRHIALDRQRAGILGGVEENRRDLAAQHDAAGALAGNVRNIRAHVPLHRVDRGLARGAGAHHVAHVGQRQAFFLQLIDCFQAIRHLGDQHFRGVQRNIRTRPGGLRGRKIVGIGLAVHLEHHALDALRQRRLAGEPLCIGPGLHQLFGMGIAGLHLFRHIVEGIEYQRGVRQRLHRIRRQGGVVQQGNQRADVIAAKHGAQHLHRVLPADQRRLNLAMRHIGEEGSLDIGRLIHPGRNTVLEQVEQKIIFTLRRRFQQLHQGGGLFGGKRQGRQALGSALGNMVTIGF